MKLLNGKRLGQSKIYANTKWFGASQMDTLKKSPDLTGGNDCAIPTFYAKTEATALFLSHSPREYHAPTSPLGAVACQTAAY
jgi:hypothetical protein